MKYFTNESREVFAFELDVHAPQGLSEVCEEEALVLAALPLPSSDPEGDERRWRDAELSALLWLRERHRDQREIEVTTTLSEDQFKALLVYLQALRDWPQSPDFPGGEHRPVTPEWISGQVE